MRYNNRIVNGYLTARTASSSWYVNRMTLKAILHRIDQRLTALDLTPRAASKQAGLSADAIRNIERGVESGKTKGASTHTISQLAPVLGVSAGWLLTGDGELERKSGTRQIQVKAAVQAGAWAEALEWDEGDIYAVGVPDLEMLRPFSLYAVEVRGPSMNRRYVDGTALVYTDMVETGEDLEPGKRYIVERERSDGDREATVKTLTSDEDGNLWLMPKSTDPRFQEPIDLSHVEGETIRILGRVHFAVTRE